VIKAFFNPNITFDSYIVWNYPSVEANPQPVKSKTLGIAGTGTGGGWYKAVQATWSIRAANFSEMKLVFLDANSADDYDKIENFVGLTAVTAVMAILSADTNGWSSRGNSKPTTLTQITYTLNEKLRRSYRMT
jgi:hypothetical protein